MSKLTYVVDLDHTLCDTVQGPDGRWKYFEATPIQSRIDVVNKLWEDGNTIIIETARGCGTKINHYEETFNQLRSWGLKFHTLRFKYIHTVKYSNIKLFLSLMLFDVPN